MDIATAAENTMIQDHLTEWLQEAGTVKPHNSTNRLTDILKKSCSEVAHYGFMPGYTAARNEFWWKIRIFIASY